jgi:hypothetical protein
LTAGLHLDFRDVREGRILFQVRDQQTGSVVPEVDLRLSQARDLASGKSNQLGRVGLEFRAADPPPTSLGKFPGAWVVATLTKAGESRDLRLLTRGVTLRRAS